MVEGECKHIEGLIPKTAFSSQKAALRESNFKRYGRFRAKKQLYGNQISRGMVEGGCIHIEGSVGFSEVFFAFAMPVLNPSLAQGKRKFLFRLFCQVGQASLQGSGKNILTAP